MDNQITVRELTAPKDIELFWQSLYSYFQRDIFPNGGEDLAYFLGGEYRAAITRLLGRETDPAYCLSFQRSGRDIGFALSALYPSEDGKCFIMEFCVLPGHRGGGTGRACARALMDWAREKGAAYFELNADTDRRRRFWRSVGFQPNGVDEWGLPLLLLPPEDKVPFTAELLTDPDDPALGWQLQKLENGFLAEIREAPLDDAKKERLWEAVREGKITFFLAKRGYRAVGMCSVSRCFSTFACSDTGVFDDFFVEPVFRRQGAARLLAERAQAWCRDQGLASLTVGCSAGDTDMYRALGFDINLGTMLACSLD